MALSGESRKTLISDPSLGNESQQTSSRVHKLTPPDDYASSTSKIFATLPLPQAPRKSRPFEYVTIQGALETKDACSSNHRGSIFLGTTKKNKEQIIKYPVESKKLLAMEACNWGYYRLLIGNWVPEDIILYYDLNPNPENPRELNYVAVGINKFENFKSYLEEAPKPDDFKNREFKRGWAKGLVASFLFDEDDAHRRNWDKYGRRIDKDMSIRPITGPYKSSRAQALTRPYTEDNFPITENDIYNFPCLVDTKRFHWPAQQNRFIPDGVNELITQNFFRKEDADMFATLRTDEDFIYFKYLYLLKFVLTPDAALRQVPKDHLGGVLTEPDPEDPEKPIQSVEDPLVEQYATYMIKKRNTLRETLIKMPQFSEFITKHGQAALEEIKQEFKQHNEEVLRRGSKKQENYHQAKYQKGALRPYDENAMYHSFISEEDIDEGYRSIFKDTKSQLRTFSRQASIVNKNSIPSLQRHF